MCGYVCVWEGEEDFANVGFSESHYDALTVVSANKRLHHPTLKFKITYYGGRKN